MTTNKQYYSYNEIQSHLNRTYSTIPLSIQSIMELLEDELRKRGLNKDSPVFPYDPDVFQKVADENYDRAMSIV